MPVYSIEVHLTYGVTEDGEYIVWWRRDRRHEITHRHLNNFNSHQRHIFKKLEVRLQRFLDTKFTCDKCIYRNQHLLTGKCNKIVEYA